MNRLLRRRVLRARDLRFELLDFARSEAPNECVGLLSRKGNSFALWKARNAAEDPRHFFAIEREEQESLLRMIWDTEHQVVGIVHSHPRSGPEPSIYDRQVAQTHPRQVLWVIVGLYGGEREPAISAQLLA